MSDLEVIQTTTPTPAVEHALDREIAGEVEAGARVLPGDLVIEQLLVSHVSSEIHRLRPRITEETGLDNLIFVAERPRSTADDTQEAPC